MLYPCLVVYVVNQRLAKNSAHDIHDCWVEVASAVNSSSRATKTAFKRETIYQVELFPHDDPCTALSRLLNGEVALIKAEILVILGKRRWEDPLFESILGAGLIVAEHKDVSIRRVAVKVTIEVNVPAFEGLSHHKLGMVVFWVVL